MMVLIFLFFYYKNYLSFTICYTAYHRQLSPSHTLTSPLTTHRCKRRRDCAQRDKDIRIRYQKITNSTDRYRKSDPITTGTKSDENPSPLLFGIIRARKVFLYTNHMQPNSQPHKVLLMSTKALYDLSYIRE